MNQQTRERRPQATRDAAREVVAAATLDTPTVPGQPIAVTGHRRPPVVAPMDVSDHDDDGNRTVTVVCPWCGRCHLHGWPAGHATTGHRVAHCAGDTANLGYVISGGAA